MPQTLRCSFRHHCRGRKADGGRQCFYKDVAGQVPFECLKPSAAALGTVAKAARLHGSAPGRSFIYPAMPRRVVV